MRARPGSFGPEVARGGVEYEDNHPTTVLDAWLKAATEIKGQKRELKPAHFYQGCIFAWNAYRGGKTITSIKFDTKLDGRQRVMTLAKTKAGAQCPKLGGSSDQPLPCFASLPTTSRHACFS